MERNCNRNGCTINVMLIDVMEEIKLNDKNQINQKISQDCNLTIGSARELAGS